MRALEDIAKDRDDMLTIVELTGAFEGIASMHISQIKDQVFSSKIFFAELWKIYRQIRVDELFRFGVSSAAAVNQKKLLILITSEGGLSGDIDEILIKQVLRNYDPKKHDIVVIGRHGAARLNQAHVKYVSSYHMPTRDTNISVTPLVAEVQKYRSSMVYYQSYISLTHQEVKNIELSKAVSELGSEVSAKNEDIISEANYIFEPSVYDVVEHLERSMLQITLSEVILESKLAQYASRFRAMSAAHDKAEDSFGQLKLSFNRVHRQLKDERLKEILNSLRGIEQ